MAKIRSTDCSEVGRNDCETVNERLTFVIGEKIINCAKRKDKNVFWY